MKRSPRGNAAEQATDATVRTEQSGRGDGVIPDTAYRAVMIGVLLLGILAVAVGVGGALVALTGGTDTEERTDVLGEFACEEFDGDPERPSESQYDVERTLLSPTEIEAFEGAVSGGRLTAELEVAGGLLGASGLTADGDSVTVDVDSDENRVTVESDDAVPVRLWVDSVTEDGTVTRSQVDICPPG